VSQVISCGKKSMRHCVMTFGQNLFSIFLQSLKSDFLDTYRVDRGGQDESNDVSHVICFYFEKLR